MKLKSSQLLAILLWMTPALLLSQEEIAPDVLFRIVSPDGWALDNREDFDNNSHIYLERELDTSRGQLWKIRKLENGAYLISNPYSEKAIDNANILDGNGNPLVQWDSSASNPNQHWTLSREGTGDYRITNRLTGMTLAFPGEEAPGAILHQLPGSSQLWRLIPTQVKEAELIPRGSHEWEDETVFQVNKEPGHVTSIPYPDTKTLMQDPRFAKPWLEPRSSRYLSLNGTWKFNWVKEPSERPVTFHEPDFDVSRWKEITIPSTLEMQGYGTPLYTNITYPFRNRPPLILPQKGYTSETEPNPVASCRRTFTLPADWDGMEVFLHFNGAYSGMYVWVNGLKAGYSEGANNDAEFNITPLLKAGENILAVELYKWTDASYIEDQDMFRLSGIHRSVYLHAKPRLHIADYHFDTLFDGDDFSKSTFTTDLFVKNGGKHLSARQTVEVTLWDPSGNKLAAVEASIPPQKEQSEEKYTLRCEVADPLLWSAEQPHLYTVVVSLKDDRGSETEAMSSKLGFRKIEIRDGRLFINARRIFFKGVNRHDMHPRLGKTIPVQAMEEDILLMKRHNINTVRTSHYPNNPEMYALYDYYGMYIMDEADLENHGNHSISDRESWQAAYVDRIERVIRRDRNHPSVIFWSLGNEGGSGKNFDAMYARAKEMDPSRPVHYEGKNSLADIDSHMYPSVENMIRYDRADRDKPYFLCEYAHAMGNAVGNLSEYWDYIENRSRRMIGGCIWDWADQGLNRIGEPGDRFYYGGDFGDRPNDSDFSCNGLVTPDRRVTAKLLEVKQVYQYIRFRLTAPVAGIVEIENRYDFTALDNFDLHWELLREGETAEQGILPLPDLAPGQRAELTVPFDRNLEAGREYLLNLRCVLKNPVSWADRGHIVASAQFALSGRTPVAPVDLTAQPGVTVSETPGMLTVSGEKFSVSFSKSTGQITSLAYGGREMIRNPSEGLRFNWYRSVSNDKYTDQKYYDSETDTPLFAWREDSTKKFVTVQSHTSVTIRSDKRIRIPVTVKYTVQSGGHIDVEASFTLTDNREIVRRLGLRMILPETYSHIRYYGRGPHENYVDRKASASLGVYETTPWGMTSEHYVRSQSLGNREDIRWISLTDARGQGIKITSKDRLNFSALPFSDADIAGTAHDFELEGIRKPEIYLNLDCIQQGLGNASCGPRPLREYLIPVNTPQSYSFRIAPLGN
ncbi:MAG: DUF4981 domain-containing protein [Proteiniphilum sp.]|nr:DUF4981 domain-containing protein [Proteiniphilum sp.]